MGEAVGWFASSTAPSPTPAASAFRGAASPPACEVPASWLAANASGLSSAFPVASGLFSGAGLFTWAQLPAWVQSPAWADRTAATAGLPELAPPGVGELVGVFCVGVVGVDDGVPDGVVVGDGLPDDDGVVVGDGLPDGVGELDGVGEQLGVVGPVEPPWLPWPDWLVPPPVAV